MPAVTPAEMTAYFRRLGGGPPAPGLDGLESVPAEPDLSAAAIKDRVARSRDTLLELLESLFGPDPTRKAVVEELVRQGGEGLRMLADRDGAGLGANPAAADGLEAIVRADGSRPSFLIREGDIDFSTSPVGTWEPRLTARADALRRAVSCVGRVNAAGDAHQGTGFLVGPDVILTNRHVLQLVATPRADGGWTLGPDTAIDFGHEHEARPTLNKRKLKNVVFWGDQAVGYPVDHAKLDLALIELEPLPGGPEPFAVQSVAPAVANPGVPVVIVGYPADPLGAYPLPLLDQLFKNSFGYKRLAPGETVATAASQQGWTLGHDATTLGGNSGSVVLALTREGVALGLHYGGRSAGPAENWSHRLDLALGRTNGLTTVPLSEVLAKYGVKMSDAAPAPAPAPAPVPAPAAAIEVVSAGPKPVTRADMVHLGEAAGATEAPGDGETSAAALADRGGYDPNFIPGFPIPLPLGRGPAADDMRARKDGSGFELKYEHFSTVVSASRRMPMMTACNIDGGASQTEPRLSRWSYDGRLDRAHQWGNELYQGLDNPLDRGHMVRREDPVWGTPAVAARANADTFHYTNSCPQMGAVNQQVWLGLENYVLGHARRDRMQVSVFTGPFFTRADPEYRGGRIPLAFWKVVAFLLPTGRPSATAYRVSQEREVGELEAVFGRYKTFQISVRQVADGTGLDLTALLPFDGFSHHEAVTGERVANRIDHLDQILV